MASDIQIAQSIELKHIKHIASKLKIGEDELEMYGKFKAKLPLSLIDEKKAANNLGTVIAGIC